MCSLKLGEKERETGERQTGEGRAGAGRAGVSLKPTAAL